MNVKKEERVWAESDEGMGVRGERGGIGEGE